MKLISDLHIHGRFSRGTSKALTIDNLEKYARMKGIGLLGTGDFTHPEWTEELHKNLSDDGQGVHRTSSGFPFLLQTEISLIYTQDGKGRRVHNVVLAPDMETVFQITDELKKRGRVDYDGRPIFKIPCPEFVEMLKEVNDRIEVIPAHIWTPHFSMFGAYNQFQTVKECFGDQVKHINAVETGLSSDPPMNWRVSELDKYNLVSFSDLHSYWPWRIGRESTVFSLKSLTYDNVIAAIKGSDTNKIDSTIEVDPNYGKYHIDGHRKCGVALNPEQSKKLDNICPVCKRPLTIGVLSRVEDMADRPIGYVKPGAPGYNNLIPLSEILSMIYKKGIATKAVWAKYDELMKLGPEFEVILNTPYEKLLTVADKEVADMIILNREGRIAVTPGYDGVYGVPQNKGDVPIQKSLGEY